MKRKIVGWGILAVTYAVAAAAARAQLENSPVQPQLQIPPTGLAVALVGYGTGGSVTTNCMDGTFEMLVVQPGETLQVTVQYPPDRALQVVDLTALDGGTLLPPTLAADPSDVPTCDGCNLLTPRPVYLSLAIRADGTVSFTFVVGLEPGLRQISLRVADQEIGLQLWVNDPTNPDSNPPGLTPSPLVNGQ
jgi:hypothetical protein